MQATLDAFSLKPFTKALTCLSRYGDELTIVANSDGLSMSTTNSSMSAFCRFKYHSHFFTKYNVGNGRFGPATFADEVEDILTATGQLLTKALLSILKHRNVERMVDRCQLSIVEGGDAAEENENQDSLESRLIVQLHCKHGVVKTHRLQLQTPTSLLAPGVPDEEHESRLSIGPRALKDMLEHFPVAKGPKNDPQLIWNFGDSEVQVKSMESSIDAKGKSQLSTELVISAEEFDFYHVHSPPISIGFHLREFNASISFAESLSLSLDLRFTDPTAPLFIDVESENNDALFVISTAQVPGTERQPRLQTPSTNNKKRDREDSVPMNNRIKKPAKVVQRADAAAVARSEHSGSSRSQGSMPPPSSIPHQQLTSSPLFSQRQSETCPSQSEPLFLPNSQLSVAELGIEDMDVDEFAAMMDGDDGDEVGFGASQMVANTGIEDSDRESFGMRDELELAPTQAGGRDDPKAFKPLFED